MSQREKLIAKLRDEIAAMETELAALRNREHRELRRMKRSQSSFARATARRTVLILFASLLVAPKVRAAEIVAVGFSPSHQCTDIETHLIESAQHEVLLQAYGFSSAQIAAALDVAKARGVDVKVILDRSNEHSSHSGRLDIEQHDIPVWIDSRHPIAHNKVTIVDGGLVETGSFNYTGQGERNGENCIVIRDADLARKYRENWLAHQAHSEREK